MSNSDADATLAAAGVAGRAYAEHASVCRLYAIGIVGAAAADDAVQEAFIGLIRHHAAGRGRIDDERAWLMAATQRAALNLARGELRRRRRETAFTTPDLFESRPGDPLDAADAGRALSDLDDRQRRAVVARLWGNLSFDAIARLLGVSASTAHATYAAALRRLRDRLDPPDHERR